jgi:hypothetical protein
MFQPRTFSTLEALVESLPNPADTGLPSPASRLPFAAPE